MTSPVLNFPASFSSNANPASFHVPLSHQFSISANAPNFSVVLYSVVAGANTFDRFANLYHGGHSTQFANQYNPRIAAGKTWNQVLATTATFARLADRQWGDNATTHGLPAGTGFYELFRFSSGGQTEYGWVQYNVQMTQANSSAASNGPNITIVQFAWETTPDTPIGAGATGTASVPEPAPLAETALGVLVLGAAALRRWRKSKAQA
jgi:hypothetical protein